MQLRRTAVLAVLVVLTLVPLGLLPAAHAAVPQCDGVDATIIGTDGPEKLFGTPGADVVWLGAGNDTFAGKDGDDLICGGDGNDVLYTGDGNDTVFGEDGVDRVYEGAGDDHLNGGPDSDTLDYSLAGGTLDGGPHLRLDARIGKTTSLLGDDTFTRFDSYVGTFSKDTLIGSAAKERIAANGGTGDVLYGFGGNDRLVANGIGVVVDAGEGDDWVRSLGEQARVLLGPGDDRLDYSWTSGAGNVLSGGTGADGIVLTKGTAGYEVNLNRGFVQHRWVRNPGPSTLVGFENVQGSPGPDRIVGNALPNFLAGNGGDDTVLGLGGPDHLFGGAGKDVADGGAGGDKCLYFEALTSC